MTKIEVHCLLHNEILMLPYFIKHYSQFADIIFYESNSTDGSPDLAELLGCKVVKIATNNNLVDERIFTDMKNNCWKGSDADWIITADTDEFVYHPDIVNILKQSPYTIFHPKEFLMYSRDFPTTNGQIYEEVNCGLPGQSGYGKMNIFKRSAIEEMNYNAGCHSCNPVGDVKICPETDIKTLHYHYAGLEYRLRKNRYIASRLSQINKQMGWGVHHTWPESKIIRDFEDAMKRLVRVI